ncbi:MAG: cytochrome b [Gammaproteobacteria bacterium]|nr:cytochrome b [Gammaproteobacteria bacterium]
MSSKYTKTAMLLHWLSAALVVGLFAIGWTMVELPKGPARGAAFALHKSLGLTVLMLTLWRFGWRLRHAAPALPSTLPAWQATLARAVHATFYLLLVLQPITGYLSSSFSGYSTNFFGLPLPEWGTHDPPLNEFFTEIHVLCSITLLLLIGTHVAGAISHVVVPGDRLLRRMLPW